MRQTTWDGSNRQARPIIGEHVEPIGDAIARRMANAQTHPVQYEQADPLAVAIAGRDGAKIPSWFLQVVVLVLVVIVIFLFLDLRDVKTRIQTQEIYMQNTREKLAENGWRVTSETKPAK